MSQEILVISLTYNKPEYVAYHYYCCQKFITNKFKYIIFDNSTDDNITKQFEDIANKLKVEYIKLPKDEYEGQGSIRAGLSANYAFGFIKQIYSNPIVALIDTDMFPVNNVDLLEILGSNDLVGIQNDRLDRTGVKLVYYTNQFLLMNFKTLPNVETISMLPCTINGVGLDTGGSLVPYLLKHNIKHHGVLNISSGYINNTNFDSVFDIVQMNYMDKNTNDKEQQKRFELLKDYFREELTIFDNKQSFSEIVASKFLHLRAGSNWYGFDANTTYYREYNLFTLLSRLILSWHDVLEEGKKYVISYSLYHGANESVDMPKYRDNLLLSCMISPMIYHGWNIRIYYNDTVSEETISRFRKFPHVELIDMGKRTSIPVNNMIWRFRTAGDPTVSHMLSRDADSWLSIREAVLVKDWVKSGKMFHIIRDHCYHSKKIMGGVWGAKVDDFLKVIPDFLKQCDEFDINKYTEKNDQGFLSDMVYPKVVSSAVIHIENQMKKSGEPANGYFPDGGIKFPSYPLIDFTLPGINIQTTNMLNSFKCVHCKKVHEFFIGNIQAKFDPKVEPILKMV